MTKKEKPITKEVIITALKQMVDNKTTVKKYLKGEVNKEALNKKGIKLARPI